VGKHDREATARSEPAEASLEKERVALDDRTAQLRNLEIPSIGGTGEGGVRRDDLRSGQPNACRRRQAVAPHEAPLVEAGGEGQELRDADGPRVDVISPRVDASSSASVEHEGAGAACRVDEAFSVGRRERADREVDDVTRRKKLPFLPFTDARDELLEQSIEPFGVVVEHGAIEQQGDGVERLVGHGEAAKRTQTGPQAVGPVEYSLDLATVGSANEAGAAIEPLCIEACDDERESHLEGVGAAGGEDQLLDAEKYAPRAIRKAGAAGHGRGLHLRHGRGQTTSGAGASMSEGCHPDHGHRVHSMRFHTQLKDAASRFLAESIDERGGKDPVAALYAERRSGYSLFSRGLSDADCEALRPYLFGRPLPRTPGEKPVTCLNLIDGEWTLAAERVAMKSLADRRLTLFEIVRSRETEIAAALDKAHAFWTSLEWAKEGLAYRKHVVKNFSRLLEHYYEECLDELRQEIPKTRLEADKDFWEAKRAADHLEGNAEKAMAGEGVPTMLAGQAYWKDAYLPAGVSVVITPMNFIYGIPGIQIVGCYLSGSPLIFKGHPFAGITNNTLVRMMIAAGANPRAIYKLEGFGGDLASLTRDARVAIVSVTGSAETAKRIQEGRGVRPVKFEGGGCNWAFLDDGYTDDELGKIAVRLTYAKLGFGSHKCTSLHGIAASRSTLDRLEPLLVKEFAEFAVKDPRHAAPAETKVLSPLMVHQAKTLESVRDAARAAGIRVLVEGGACTDDDYGKNAEVVAPVLLARVTPETRVRVVWDDKGMREIALATTEFFMPILVTMEIRSFDAFVRFCLLDNPHDLAVSLWTRDDAKLVQGRRTLGGMVKENDGTDSALEWEEFGASGVGESGNTGVGDAQTTIAMFCRKQKGRHFVF
jgi:acyl-CoA reductase-like NAD-dependent aldehyde dehydrogenase